MTAKFIMILMTICTFSACKKTAVSEHLSIKPVSCENSFAVNDNNHVWLFDFKTKENKVSESFYLKYDQRAAVSQANYSCQTNELAVGYAFRGKSGRDAGIDFIGEKGMSTISLNPDSFGFMISLGSELFVYTALMKRDKIDPNLGAMTKEEYAPKSMPHHRNSEISFYPADLSEHVFIDMLAINLNRHSVDRRFRFPTSFGLPMWVEGDNFIIYNSTPLAINSQSGYRTIKVNNFNDLPDFQQFRRHIPYYNGKFYTVVGKKRDEPIVKTEIIPNSIYVHNNSTSKWEKIASLNFEPVHVTSFKNEIVIFGRDTFARFDVSKETLVTEKRDFDGMIAAACAWIKDGRVVLMSHPDSRPDTYGGGELWVYDVNWKKVLTKVKLDEIALPNITSQLCPFPSAVSYNSL